MSKASRLLTSTTGIVFLGDEEFGELELLQGADSRNVVTLLGVYADDLDRLDPCL